MKSIGVLLLSAVSIAMLSGCSFITSGQPSTPTVTGEAWYTKTRFFIIPYANEIYYCDGQSNVCKLAAMP
ncbi:hypothetical protein [Chondromyces apiculatus]|uniref:Lipoprotein n=1 Tax=Chondromyces apiculatus DSM 436 TaxID=1192034 RepID=A0A017T3R7_9BACT|nr:hypothetical protein [Chondromyces apiculatus]EYF03894.1 Hypothetical protein CAP_5158 [Chondromyces apiculatus DSM 436]